MKCPHCDVNLVMSERNGVEIDYCPDCRGLWLDRGELDKIIERSGEHNRKSFENYQKNPKEYDNYSHDYKKKKKDSFLSDLFDF